MSLATRVIARLDIKPSLGVVKGRRMEGLRVVGDPHTLALRYAEQGADEILYLDVTSSLYGQPISAALVSRTARDVYVPLTVGGGIRTLGDVRTLLRAGADKVAINTEAFRKPKFITEIAEAFGSQCVVVSIEAKNGKCFANAGRDAAHRTVRDWCHEAVGLGAGEILLTSIDRDGTCSGMDLSVLTLGVPVPVIVSGGCSTGAHAVSAIESGADAVAIGAALHNGTLTIQAVKDALAEAGYEVRR